MGLPWVCYILHDDASYLAASMQSFQAAGKVFAFLSRVPGTTSLGVGLRRNAFE